MTSEYDSKSWGNNNKNWQVGLNLFKKFVHRKGNNRMDICPTK
jgi:hypothetical protein